MSTKFLIPFLLLSYVFLLSFNLVKLPLYLDEGLYIFWAYLFSSDPAYAYISMQDGKTPLFIWMTSWVNSFFNNFIYSGRFISVIASVVNLVCWLIIGMKILGRKSWVFIFLMFIVTPYNIMISRLAFVDSLLIALGSLSILGIFLAKESSEKKQIFRTLIYAVFSGVFLGLAFFTKTTAAIYLLGVLVVLGYWGLLFLKKKKYQPVVFLVLTGFIVAGIYFEMMGYLKFGALRHWEMIANKESVLVFSLPEIYRKFFVEHDFSVHIKNISVTGEYLLFYFGPVLLLFAAGLVWIFKEPKHFWILLLILIFGGGVFLSAKVPASRYLAIIIPEVLIISVFGLAWIWEKKNGGLKIFASVLILVSVFLSLTMVLNPLDAYYSSDDRANFVDYNLNALGLNESIDYLEPRKDTAAVAVTGIWGVAEGAEVAFKEKEIEVYKTTRIVSSHPKKEVCEEDFKELDNQCWKIDFGDISKNPKEKYVYFISEDIDIETFKKLADIEVVKEFARTRTNLNTYLIKINEQN